MKHLISSFTLLLLSTLAFGQVPNTFSSGETISSSKINANFSFLADAMARGDLKKMMFCKSKYVVNSNEKNMSRYDQLTNIEVVFGNCFTDNVTKEKYSFVCDPHYINFDTSGNAVCENGSSNQYVISSSELINQGWIMHNVVLTSHTEYWFYKVSAD